MKSYEKDFFLPKYELSSRRKSVYETYHENYGA